MAYQKQTWDTTSYVNPTRLNHIEEGIYEASINSDADKLYYNGTGNPLEFVTPDGGKVNESEVSFKPIQDLHGYTSPWVGGSGKNKLENNVTDTTLSSTLTVTNNGDGSITINGTLASTGFASWNIQSGATSSGTQNDEKKHLPNGNYTLSGGASGISLQILATSSSGTSDLNVIRSGDGDFTVDDTYSYNWGRILVTAGTYNNVKIYPMVRAQGTSASFEPWENICPITGYTEINIYQSDTDTTSADETYTESLGSTYYGGKIDFATGKLIVDRTIVDLGSLTWTYKSQYSFFYATLPETGYQNGNKSYISGCCANYSFSGINVSDATMGTAADGTLWGRTDVALTEHIFTKVYIKDSRYTDGATFKTALDGVKLVYELATPTEITLTAEEIELLSGKNVLWTDGDEITLSARLFIDSENVKYNGDTVKDALDSILNIIAPVETSLTASRAYAVGEQFIYNDVLYKATSAISLGGTIIIGTNAVQAPSITEQIFSILNS